MIKITTTTPPPIAARIIGSNSSPFFAVSYAIYYSLSNYFYASISSCSLASRIAYSLAILSASILAASALSAAKTSQIDSGSPQSSVEMIASREFGSSFESNQISPQLLHDDCQKPVVPSVSGQASHFKVSSLKNCTDEQMLIIWVEQKGTILVISSPEASVSVIYCIYMVVQMKLPSLRVGPPTPIFCTLEFTSLALGTIIVFMASIPKSNTSKLPSDVSTILQKLK